jgi:hypothetical protein
LNEFFFGCFWSFVLVLKHFYNQKKYANTVYYFTINTVDNLKSNSKKWTKLNLQGFGLSLNGIFSYDFYGLETKVKKNWKRFFLLFCFGLNNFFCRLSIKAKKTNVNVNSKSWKLKVVVIKRISIKNTFYCFNWFGLFWKTLFLDNS